MLASIFCAPQLESTFSIISNIPCWLGLIGTGIKKLSAKLCLWDNNEARSARRPPWKQILEDRFYSKNKRIQIKIESSLKVIVEDWKNSCCLFFYFIVVDNNLKINYQFTSSPNEQLTQILYLYSKIFGGKLGVADCYWRRYFCSKGMVLLRSKASSSLQKLLVHHHQMLAFGPYEGNHKVSSSFALQTFVTAFTPFFSMDGHRHIFVLHKTC